jgi:hypothetical protein
MGACNTHRRYIAGNLSPVWSRLLNMTILSVEIAEVKIGVISITGLMDVAGNYYVGIPQIAERFDVPQKNAARDFKSLLGNDSTFLKAKINNSRVTMNAISLRDFEALVTKLDRKGNVHAQSFRDVLFGLSLHQLFSDAFGVKFEAEDRQDLIKRRQLTKDSFWFIADATKWYYDRNPRIEKYENQNYTEVFDALNLGLFGVKAAKIKKELGISKNALNRDHFGKEALTRIEVIQRIAEAQILYHCKTPVDAINIAISTMGYDQIHWKE